MWFEGCGCELARSLAYDMKMRNDHAHCFRPNLRATAPASDTREAHILVTATSSSLAT